MRALDFYSGVGGWSLGLSLAGIEVVASVDRFEPANETNRRNNGHHAYSDDIRTMNLSDLPRDVDLIVGSPPCTQFSFSNRGGKGDLQDGLKDIARFLSIVDFLKPKHWAMENVPRVAAILERELQDGGSLERFQHLGVTVQVINMETLGLPQRRKRCIAGNIDFQLLAQYAAVSERLTLGSVVRALRCDPVVDPLYGISVKRSRVSEHVLEEPLDEEEERVNRASKTSHPIYNGMPFPDPLDRSVRTITATCTRVSRESVVIQDDMAGGRYRRLTLRERACLQGFPLTFQFFGASHGQKATMIGNAVPPLFSYYVGQACLGTPVGRLPPLTEVIHRFKAPDDRPHETKVDRPGHRYPSDRTFRFSIPNCNFKSGMRFELTNRNGPGFPNWGVGFFFGKSTDVQSIQLDGAAERALIASLPLETWNELEPSLGALQKYLTAADVFRLQDVWTRKRPGLTRPFDLLDELGRCCSALGATLATVPEVVVQTSLEQLLRTQFENEWVGLSGLRKLRRHARPVIAGALVGALTNALIGPPSGQAGQQRAKA